MFIKIPMAEKAVEKELKSIIKKKVQEDIDKIRRDVTQKTIFYALWSFVGIILLSFSFVKPLFYVASGLMIICTFYFLWQFLQVLKKVNLSIDNFDKEIKKIVKTDIQSVKKDSITKRMALYLSGKSDEDIENICIAYFVREVAKWIKTHKSFIVIRLVAYTVAVLLFKEILVKILSST